MFTAQITVATALIDHAALQHVAVTVAVGGLPRALQLPTSLQPASSGSTEPGSVFSITATSMATLGRLAKASRSVSEIQIGGVLFEGRPAAHHLRYPSLQFGEHGAGPNRNMPLFR